MKKKVLIIGPIGDFGGRELEAGFIANSLSDNYDVEVCSTADITKNSQVFETFENGKVYSLKQLILKKNKPIRLLAKLSFIKNKKKEESYYYVNNQVAKKLLKYELRINELLSGLIQNFDLIFIIAQLSSNYLKFIIEEGNKLNKKIVFRTTGYIEKNNWGSFLNKVDLFIHHSDINANRLICLENHNFQIIDQCAFNEKDLLNLPYVYKKCNSFLTLGRLIKDKNIDIVIKSFLLAKEEGDSLVVLGGGPELENLKEIADNNSNIFFTGFIPNENLASYFSKVDCIIIPHYNCETGPLTGIEAMAAARIIISAKTGAMESRLSFNRFWFNNNVFELEKQIKEVKLLDKLEAQELSIKIRNRYKQYYRKDIIKKKYINVVNLLIN